MARSSLIGGEKKEIIDDILTGRNPTRLILQFVKRVSPPVCSTCPLIDRIRRTPRWKKKKKRGEKTWKQTVRQFRRGKLFVSSVGIDMDRPRRDRRWPFSMIKRKKKKKKERKKRLNRRKWRILMIKRLNRIIGWQLFFVYVYVCVCVFARCQLNPTDVSSQCFNESNSIYLGIESCLSMSEMIKR